MSVAVLAMVAGTSASARCAPGSRCLGPPAGNAWINFPQEARNALAEHKVFMEIPEGKRGDLVFRLPGGKSLTIHRETTDSVHVILIRRDPLTVWLLATNTDGMKQGCVIDAVAWSVEFECSEKFR